MQAGNAGVEDDTHPVQHIVDVFLVGFGPRTESSPAHARFLVVGGGTTVARNESMTSSRDEYASSINRKRSSCCVTLVSVFSRVAACNSSKRDFDVSLIMTGIAIHLVADEIW